MHHGRPTNATLVVSVFPELTSSRVFKQLNITVVYCTNSDLVREGRVKYATNF